MESAYQAKARGSNAVIERKLVTVSTPSTAADSNIGPDAVHLLALKELTTASNGCRVFGFAFLDYAALQIWVGSLHDDDSSAALGALLVQVSPREIIYETSGLSKETHASMRKYASAGTVKMQLTPLSTSNFSDASHIRMLIHLKGYFKASNESWLSALDSLVNQDAAVCALGGLTGHLARLMIKTFCTLIRGLKVGIKLLNDLRRGDHGISALSKVVEIPILSSLDELINNFDEAIDKEFPKDQDRSVKDDDHNTLIVLVELFVGKVSEWSLVINALSTIDVLRSFAPCADRMS